MRDPERLLSAGATDDERLLLSAALGEQPPADGQERLRVLLGLSGAVLASGAVAASAHSLPPAAAANAVLTTGKTAAVSATVKAVGAKLTLPWIALALTGAGIATAVVMLTPSRPNVEPKPRSVVSPPAPLAAPVEAARPEVQALQPNDGIDLEGNRASEPRRSAPKIEAKSAPKLTQSIARETADLDAARAALRAGSSGRALKELDRYLEAHPRGVLQQEATVLRIEALLHAHEPAKAQRIAKAFLKAHPQSPYTSRVHSLLEDAARTR